MFTPSSFLVIWEAPLLQLHYSSETLTCFLKDG